MQLSERLIVIDFHGQNYIVPYSVTYHILIFIEHNMCDRFCKLLSCSSAIYLCG